MLVKKIMFAAFIAGAMLCVSCKSNVEKMVDLKKDLVEAIDNGDMEKAEKITVKIDKLNEKLSDEERKEVLQHMMK